MNKKYVYIFLLLLALLHIMTDRVYAYTPTVDSLFRNGSNKDVSSSTVVAVLKIEKIQQENAEQIVPASKSAVKILLSSEEAKSRKFIQIDYRDGIVSDSTLNKIHYKNNLSLKNLGLLRSDQQEAALFYSLINTLLVNDSSLFMEFLKTIDQGTMTNKELINKDQLRLLKHYKYYISKKAEDETQLEVKNPLDPEDEEKKEEVQKILSNSFLNKDLRIKRVRQNNRFFWDYNADGIYARFDGENHKLRKLILSLEQGKIEIDCYNYILFNANMEFPEVIYFKGLSGNMYEIKMTQNYVIKDNPSSFARRLKNYEKKLNENKDRDSEIIKPFFLI